MGTKKEIQQKPSVKAEQAKWGTAIGIVAVPDVSIFNVKAFIADPELTATVEREVDTWCMGHLKGLAFGKPYKLCLDKTGVASIDKNVKSKTGKNGTGKIDVGIMEGSNLLVLIENKVSAIRAHTALKEAIHYCESLISSGSSETRIAVGFNGRDVQWQVLVGIGEDGSYVWKPFTINGVECRSFPTPELVKIIYSGRGVHGIVEDKSLQGTGKKALLTCVNALRQKYRQVSFIQNDNHTAIDFTIAFISLKSILEKHGSLLPKSDWQWSGLRGGSSSELQQNIASCVRYICNEEDRARETKKSGVIDLAKTFREIFIQREDHRHFDFPQLIERFSGAELDALSEIFDEIGKLPVLHSSRIDLFGETYELLADKKTKSAFGQFFTGRHIIKPLFRLLLESEVADSVIGPLDRDGKAITPKKFCDPACGTGGFLMEAFKHVRDKYGSSLSDFDVDDYAKKAFYGYDIFSGNITKTKINLYLAGDGYSELEVKDSLSDQINHTFDYIITNPPYGPGSIVVDDSIVGSSRLEVNFLIRIVNLLKAGGKALIVLPDGIFESPSLVNLRLWLIKHCRIDKVVGLPKFSFAPYTKEKTYALFITKRSQPLSRVEDSADLNERIWFYIVDNDGFANSDKRYATDLHSDSGEWLHDELSDWVDDTGKSRHCLLYQRWLQQEQRPGDVFLNEWSDHIPGRKFGYVGMDEVLRQEIVSFPAVSKAHALKLVRQSLIDGGSDFIPRKPAEMFDDGQLVSEVEEVLANIGLSWDEVKSAFISLDNKQATKIVNLLPEKYFREPAPTRVDVVNLFEFLKEIRDTYQRQTVEQGLS